jgi:hypothetical protein
LAPTASKQASEQGLGRRDWVKRPLPLFDFLHNQRSLNHCAYSQRSSRSSVVVQARDVIGFSSRQLSVRHLRERDGRPHTTAQSVNVGLLPSSLAARNAAKTCLPPPALRQLVCPALLPPRPPSTLSRPNCAIAAPNDGSPGPRRRPRGPSGNICHTVCHAA